jgi:hypothetical protein
MIKRHGLVVFLFCFSIILGIAVALFEAAKVFFFSIGVLFLVGLAAALFVTVAILWLTLKRKSHIRNPEQSVRHQGTAFGIWFAVHNFSWAFTGSIFIWGVFKLFGFKPWVMIFSAGALACTCFALIGTFLIRQREMLGLCWQSAIPDGLANFWARAGATMILRERYEYAVENDQKQHTPLLWSISRIFNRSKAGGADRGIDLLEPRPTFLAKKLKKEWLHRFKVLLVLFCVTAALAALSGILFASHHWDRVPDGWPSDKIKASKVNKPQMMASKSSPQENKEKKSSKDEDKQTDQDQKKQPGSDNKTDQKEQRTNDPDQYNSNREQNRKEGQDEYSESKREQETQNNREKEDSQGQESKKGEPGQKTIDQETEGQEQCEGQGQGQGQQGKGQGQGQGQKQDQAQSQGQGQGQKQGQGQSQGQCQGQQAQAQGQGQKQQGQGQGEGQGQQDQGQNQGQGQGQAQSKRQGQGQGQKQKSQGQGQGQKGQDQRQGQGRGQGQGQQKQDQEQNQGQGQGQEQQGQGQGQDQGQQAQGKGQGKGQGQQGQGQGQDQGQKGQGEGQGQGQGQGQDQGKQGQGQGEGQGEGQEQGQGQGQGKSQGKSDGAGPGIGEGQGSGDPDKPPEMLSEPERLPEIPSRATEMVTLELPTLKEAESKGSKDPEKETPDDGIPSPKSKAPITQFKTGKQDRRSTKPEQYLPNWILNLMREQQKSTTKDTKKSK